VSSKNKRYLEFLEHLPANTQDKSLIAVKGHLLLEVVLREYIYERVKHPDRLRNKNITFSNLIDFASSLEDNNRIQWAWKALRLANQIRNKLAHSLLPEKLNKLELEFIEYVVANDGELTVETAEELQFENLTLAYFQLFDVILSSFQFYKNKERPPLKSKDSLDRVLQAVAQALEAIERTGKEQKGSLNNKKGYVPQRSDNRKNRVRSLVYG